MKTQPWQPATSPTKQTSIETTIEYVTIRGVKHYCEWIRQSQSTTKPVLVFLHGWGGSGRYWRPTATALAPWFDCLLYDLRGFGRSPLSTVVQPPNPRAEHYSMEAYGEDLRALLDHYQLKRVTLNSHSMGASIAVLFANQYPQRVERLILTCNGLLEYDPKAFAAFHKFGAYVVKFRYRWFMRIPELDRIFIARFLRRPIPRTERRAFLEDFLLADYEAALGTIYTSVSKQAVDAMPIAYQQLSMPTLLISGEYDQIITAKMGQMAAELNPLVQYVMMSQTGHLPMLEDASAYLSHLQTFLGVADPSTIS